MKNVKAIIIPAIAMLVICLVSAFLLAGTNSLTKDTIKENEIKQIEESRKALLPFMVGHRGERTYNINGKEVSGLLAFDGTGNDIGYIFTSSSKGYGGEVKVMTALDMNGKVLKTVVLSMSDETPGLGQNASKPDFLEKFSGNGGPFIWVKNNGSGNEIQGVTSATFTSKAVIECVNDAVSAYNMMKEEATENGK